MSARVLATITPAEPWGGAYVTTEHDLQALYAITNSLLDAVLTMTPSEALKLVRDLTPFRERLDAVIGRAFDQADGFTETTNHRGVGQ